MDQDDGRGELLAFVLKCERHVSTVEPGVSARATLEASGKISITEVSTGGRECWNANMDRGATGRNHAPFDNSGAW
jgi:hypothetical protein